MDSQDLPFPHQAHDLCASSSSVLFGVGVAEAGEGGLDANDYLIRHRIASYYFTVEGDSMRGVGILDGDKVLVDRAVEPKDGHIVVAVVNSEYTLRRLHHRGKAVELHAENPAYAPIRLKADEALQIWGVVVGVVRKIAV